MANYTEKELDAIFYGTTAPLGVFAFHQHPHDARGDETGNIIARSQYGRYSSPYGWEVDHRNALVLGGTNHPHNLRALKCSVNRSLGALLAGYSGFRG